MEIKKKPIIGIVPLIDYQKVSCWMLPQYMGGILQGGGIPIMLPLIDNEGILQQLAHTCDGFLFTSGQDVSPELYAEEKLPQCGECSKERDRMETVLFKEAMFANKPILGISRGIQFINVMLGGSLYQDIPSQVETDINHRQKPPYHVPAHSVSLPKRTPLFQMFGIDSIMVNSFHHQAVKKLSSELEAMAVSEDGLIEGVYMPKKKFVWAVQWHPEFSYLTDVYSKQLFRAFVNAAKDSG